jgi:EPS-associated MarR family transcriptional regulator
MNESEDTHLQLLRQLDLDPRLNQRRLAQRLGLSLGKVNYCVQALVGKGLIKISNFRRSDNKVAYAYLLTPAGLQEKSRLTISFLKTKQQEYERLRAEIAELQVEVETLGLDPDATRRGRERRGT